MLQQISKFALLILVIAILYLLITGNIFSASPFVIGAQVLAIGISVWARRSFKSGGFNIHAEPKGEQLIVSGPYKYIRHPMYTSALLLIWSSVLSHLSPLEVGIGVIVTTSAFVRIAVEEQFLRARFADYENYSYTTSRIIPFLI
ncbi:isoprenylcysteine carboxylmethyltransferase family protein [candidate division KSB1 bacterium]|nr:isoprenylcysteine carboxylmethyltransferase family protein [candidate division KSB1 bacterium]